MKRNDAEVLAEIDRRWREDQARAEQDRIQRLQLARPVTRAELLETLQMLAMVKPHPRIAEHAAVLVKRWGITP